jgi:hypothetical protein
VFSFLGDLFNQLLFNIWNDHEIVGKMSSREHEIEIHEVTPQSKWYVPSERENDPILFDTIEHGSGGALSAEIDEEYVDKVRIL